MTVRNVIAHRIPSGMLRPVENAATYTLRRVIARHEATVRDASLSGCGAAFGAYHSTERHSLTGMAPAQRHCEAKQSNPQTATRCLTAFGDFSLRSKQARRHCKKEKCSSGRLRRPAKPSSNPNERLSSRMQRSGVRELHHKSNSCHSERSEESCKSAGTERFNSPAAAPESQPDFDPQIRRPL